MGSGAACGSTHERRPGRTPPGTSPCLSKEPAVAARTQPPDPLASAAAIALNRIRWDRRSRARTQAAVAAMSAPNEGDYSVQVARWLAQRVPIYVGPLDAHGDPFRWNGWQRSPLDPNVMDGWRPGLGVGLVCGVVCDVI